MSKVNTDPNRVMQAAKPGEDATQNHWETRSTSS
jgi:hypothetical protein